MIDRDVSLVEAMAAWSEAVEDVTQASDIEDSTKAKYEAAFRERQAAYDRLKDARSVLDRVLNNGGRSVKVAK